MLTWEDDVEIHALRQRGWSISAIARHLGRDRKTVRAYLTGIREPGKRDQSVPDPFAPFVPCVTARLQEDPHVWATALYDEIVALGFGRSYPTFTRALRTLRLRPHCEACAGAKGRPTIEIAHPPGEEIQWDWLELPAPRGAARPTCSSARFRTRAAAGPSSPKPTTRPTWSRPSTASCAGSGGPPTAGGSTACPASSRSAATGSCPASPRSPSPTASPWTSVLPVAPTARAGSRRRTTSSPNGGGAPRRRRPRARPRRILTASWRPSAMIAAEREHARDAPARTSRRGGGGASRGNTTRHWRRRSWPRSRPPRRAGGRRTAPGAGGDGRGGHEVVGDLARYAELAEVTR